MALTIATLVVTRVTSIANILLELLAIEVTRVTTRVAVVSDTLTLAGECYVILAIKFHF